MLGDLASAAWDFAVATVVLGTLSGLLVQALYESGFQGRFQRRQLLYWLEVRLDATRLPESEKPSVSTLEQALVAGTRSWKFYSLPYDQLCGQVSAAINRLAQDPRQYRSILLLFAPELVVDRYVAALEGGTEGDTAHDALVFHIERAVDELQLILRRRSSLFDYTMTFTVTASVFLLLAVTPNQFSSQLLATPLYLALILASTLVGPVARRSLERLLR